MAKPFDHQTKHQDRQGADGHGDAQTSVGFTPLAMAKGPGDAAQHLGEIGSEVGDHGPDAAELDRRDDRHPRIAPAQQHRHSFEVGGAADWQKFRQALNDTEDEIPPAGLTEAESSSRIGH